MARPGWPILGCGHIPRLPSGSVDPLQDTVQFRLQALGHLSVRGLVSTPCGMPAEDAESQHLISRELHDGCSRLTPYDLHPVMIAGPRGARNAESRANFGHPRLGVQSAGWNNRRVSFWGVRRLG